MKEIMVLKEIDNSWGEYDQWIGKTQLMNYGVIFADEYGFPLDDEYEVEALYEIWKGEQ